MIDSVVSSIVIPLRGKSMSDKRRMELSQSAITGIIANPRSVSFTPHSMQKAFKIQSRYQPAGDQPTAIKQLVEGINDGELHQTLLGVTGSGKTFTVANVIQQTPRPAMILVPNKTLAAQPCRRNVMKPSIDWVRSLVSLSRIIDSMPVAKNVR